VYIESYRRIEKLLHVDSLHWILVNDGSATITSEQLELISGSIDYFSYYSLPENKGKGYATRHGVSKATTEYTIYTDIDFPYEDQNIKDVFQRLAEGADVVLCVRDDHYYDQISRTRAYLSRAFKSAIRLLFRIPVADTQAGLKGLSAKGKEALLCTSTDRYLFDLEMVRIAHKRKLRFATVEARLKNRTELSSLSFSILKQEFLNLVRILFS